MTNVKLSYFDNVITGNLGLLRWLVGPQKDDDVK